MRIKNCLNFEMIKEEKLATLLTETLRRQMADILTSNKVKNRKRLIPFFTRVK